LIVGAIVVIANLDNIQLRKTQKLTSDIKTFEQTETQLVLIRDRLTKIKEIGGSNNTVEKVNRLRGLLESYDDRILLGESKVNSEGITLSAVFLYPKDLTKFLDSIYIKTDSKNIKMNSLKYLTGKGYEVSITLL